MAEPTPTLGPWVERESTDWVRNWLLGSIERVAATVSPVEWCVWDWSENTAPLVSGRVGEHRSVREAMVAHRATASEMLVMIENRSTPPESVYHLLIDRISPTYIRIRDRSDAELEAYLGPDHGLHYVPLRVTALVTGERIHPGAMVPEAWRTPGFEVYFVNTSMTQMRYIPVALAEPLLGRTQVLNALARLKP